MCRVSSLRSIPRTVRSCKMIVTAILCAVLVSLYICTRKKFKYWEEKGIKHDKPLLLLGNNASNFLLQKSVTQVAMEQYWKYPNEKVVGFYRGSRPELVIRDPKIIKRVLITDFAYFYPRGLNPHKIVVEPLLKNLFFADGDLWRLLRQRMTPAFTSGKLKAMFPLIVERAEQLQIRALSAAAAGKAIDARDMMARYTTDFIGACGFGLKSDSLEDENSAFRKLGANIFHMSPLVAMIAICKELFPEIFKHAKTLGRIEKDLFAIVDEILRQRNHMPSGRNDFIDLLLECQRKGTILGDSIEKFKSDGTPEEARLEMNDELIAAQVFVFFAAGFETSSSASSFTLLQLAYNPEVQKKVQEEIDAVLARHNKKLSYDAVKEMTYLEWAFKEGMRMFPSLGFLVRQCARNYTIPELNITIDKGVTIIIPVQALHNDPKYFENPEVFRPERFHPDQVKDSNKYIYLPFGEGPRACIGERLGLLQSLAGLAAVLSKFTVSPAPDTQRHPVVDPKSNIVQVLKDGIPLIFKAREKTIIS